jgi:LPS sulfotransferase NodH
MHYVVLCQARTGSTYLVRLLRSHPGIVSHGELFQPDAIYWADRPAQMDAAALAERDADPVTFLRTVHAAAPRGVPVGFKIFPTHSPTILEHVRASPELRRITLRRDNLLAQFSSGLIADATGRYSSDRPRASVRVKFDEQQFLRFVRRISAELELLADTARSRAAQPDLLDLEYSDLFAPGIGDRLTSFLGVARRALRARRLVRQNPGRIVDRFHNRDEVHAFLDRFGRPDWADEQIEA